MAIDGTNGNDTLIGTVFADTINGFDGDDMIDGGGSADILNGGSGDDTFRYTNSRHFDAGETINGGTGNDRLLLNVASTFDIRTTHISSIEELEFGVADIVVDLDSSQIGAGLSSTATIDGSGTSAQLIFHVNTPNVDFSNLNFQQWDEADNRVTIYGSVYMEDDPLSWYFWDRALGSGTSITGSTVDDVIYGSEGADIIRGHLGNDNIVATGGLDRLYGGEGDDRFIYNYRWIGSKDEIIDGGAGTDTIRLLNSGEYDFRITTLSSIEELDFDTWRDKKVIINSSQLGSGLSASATLSGDDDGGESELQIHVDTASTDLSGLTFQDWVEADDEVMVFGTRGADTVLGTSVGDTIYGNRGADSLHGNGGDDALYGGGWSDRVYGGDGDDSIHGNRGNDRLFGGDGDDTIIGGHGRDYILGGAGSDQIYGNGFADRLYGNSGDDFIYGGAGSDIINGGVGSDNLWGGSGAADDGAADRFIFGNSFGDDRIHDFENDIDKIDFSGNATFNDFATVSSSAVQVGSDILITQDAGNRITINDMNLADLDASDFIF